MTPFSEFEAIAMGSSRQKIELRDVLHDSHCTQNVYSLLLEFAMYLCIL